MGTNGQLVPAGTMIQGAGLANSAFPSSAYPGVMPATAGAGKALVPLCADLSGRGEKVLRSIHPNPSAWGFLHCPFCVLSFLSQKGMVARKAWIDLWKTFLGICAVFGFAATTVVLWKRDVFCLVLHRGNFSLHVNITTTRDRLDCVEFHKISHPMPVTFRSLDFVSVSVSSLKSPKSATNCF